MIDIKKDKFLIAIAGATASGKTGLSIGLAKKLKIYANCEIVSFDSMQIYKHMNIGTAKPDLSEQAGIPHHMFDLVEPYETYTAARYQKEARQVITDIYDRGNIPILVGGTGFYLNAVIYDMSFTESDVSIAYRKELENLLYKYGNDYLYNMLIETDPERAEQLHPNDSRRVMRALEVHHTTGIKMSEQSNDSYKPMYNHILFGIDMDRRLLYERIEKRVDIMIENNLIDEVNKVYDIIKYSGIDPKKCTAMQALGYKEIIEYIENRITKEEAVELLKRDTRRYAKRQLTWCRRYKEMIWLTQNNKINEAYKETEKILGGNKNV